MGSPWSDAQDAPSRFREIPRYAPQSAAGASDAALARRDTRADRHARASPHLARLRPEVVGYAALGGGVSGASDRSRAASARSGRDSVRSASATALAAAGKQNGSTPAGVIVGWLDPPHVPSMHGTLRDPVGARSESAFRAAAR